MNKRQARAEGYAVGYEIASNIDWRLDYQPDLSVDDVVSAVMSTEENARQFSPFEFFSKEIWSSGDRADGLWDAYDEGISAGAQVYAKRVLKL